MPNPSTRKPWLLFGLCFLLAGCPAAAILIPPLVQFGASLLDSAVNNHDEIHEQNMQTLLTALQQRTNPYMGQSSMATPHAQMGGYAQPGYHTQDEIQQGHDPYQDSQPQYGESSPYPNTQDPTQFPQGNPYANNPNIVPPHIPPSGYPSNNQYENPYQEPPNSPAPPMQPSYPQQGQPYPDRYAREGMNGDPSMPRPYESMPSDQADPLIMGQAQNIPISLDVLLVKKHLVNGVSSYLPIQDGETLFDGKGNAQAGDKFRVMFRANTNCYVYVIAVDGSAWAQGIFPSTARPFANPVKAGQQYLLPEGNNWFSLDQYKGVETLFVVASHERRPDIEQILATISGRERHPAEKLLAVSEPTIIPNGYSGARLGTAPFAFNTSQTRQQELLPTTYFVKTAGEDLRITRWFRHQ